MSREFYYHETYQDYGRERLTYAVQRLILANTVVFAVQLAFEIPLGPGQVPGGIVALLLSFQPGSFTSFFLWQPLTYMFLHGSLWHLFVNMLMLFVFGPEVERALGTRQFFRFYMLCGGLGVLFTMLSRGDVTVCGASGATMGVLIAHAVVNPHRELFLFPFAVPLNVRAFVFIAIILNLISAMAPNSATSVWTHFGGMGVGYAYMKLVPRFRGWRLQRKNRRPRPVSKADHLDAVGEAVDNIFKFDDERRRRQ